MIEARIDAPGLQQLLMGAGLGDAAAQSVMKARDSEGIFSVEDLKKAGNLSKSVIELLSQNGVLNGMSKTNQLTFL